HDFLQVARKDQVLDVGPKYGHTVARRRFFYIAQDVFAEAIAVRQNLFEVHGCQRAASRQLHVGIETVLVIGDLMQGRLGIADAKLHEDADADGHLVGGEDFLPFDGQVALADIHQHDLNARPAVKAQVDVPRNNVAAGVEDLDKFAVLVPESTVGVLD